MSNRTLIEINHDYAKSLNTPAFLDALANYVRSADEESRDAQREMCSGRERSQHCGG